MRAQNAVPLAVTIAALSVVAGCQRRTTSGEGPILIGHVACLTGSEATFGQSIDRAVKMAVAEQNAAGGVKGRKIEVKTLDDQSKPEEAAVAATRLVSQDKVLLLIGEAASTRSLAMAPIADRYQVPMITPASTNPRVTKDGDKTRPYVFRVCFIDPFQGTVMARFATDELKLKRMAVLRDVGSDYSVGLASFFVDRFKQLGGSIVADESYKGGDQDFKAQLTAIKAREPEALYVPGYYVDVALIARQTRELGMKQPLLGGDGFDSPKLFEIGGAAVEGSYFTNHYSTADPEPRIQQFVAKYREAYNETPDSFAATGYDAAKVAFDALGRASELTGPAIRDAIAATKDFPGVTGVITIDADHNAVKPAVVLKVESGAARWVATVKP